MIVVGPTRYRDQNSTTWKTASAPSYRQNSNKKRLDDVGSGESYVAHNPRDILIVQHEDVGDRLTDHLALTARTCWPDCQY